MLQTEFLNGDNGGPRLSRAAKRTPRRDSLIGVMLLTTSAFRRRPTSYANNNTGLENRPARLL